MIMAGQKVFLLAARKEEISRLLDTFEFEKVAKKNLWNFSADNLRISAATVGVGKKAVKKEIGRLPEELFSYPLLITGTAGGLTEKLNKQDLFLGETVSGEINSKTYRANNHFSSLIKTVLKQSRFVTGHLHSANNPVVQTKKRRKIHDKFSADAVDMETYFLLHRLQKSGYNPPWTALRVISDTEAHDELEKIKSLQQEACRRLNRALIKIFSALKEKNI